ncbi:MAG: OmpA family protein [Gammaproteobacteria bacterium]|nr:OmpA family protein [Gammaproteobacteria bacterium]
MIGFLFLSLMIGKVSENHAEDLEIGRTWYIGGMIGQSTMDPSVTGYTVQENTNTGIKMIVGYDISQSLSVEVFLSDLRDVKLSPSGQIDYSVPGVNVAWYFMDEGDENNPFGYRHGFQPFAELGLGAKHVTANVPYRENRSFQLIYGAGLEYGWKNGFALRTGIDVYDTDASLIYLGAIKRFGRERKKRGQSALTKNIINNSAADNSTTSTTMVPVIAASSVSAVDNTVNDTGNSKEMVEIFCEPNSSYLTKKSKSTLDALAVILVDSPKQRIEIDAHTDSIGSEKYNLWLSEKRADSVQNYLIKKGIDAERLSITNYGEKMPVENNNTVYGRTKNRRVELNFIME